MKAFLSQIKIENRYRVELGDIEGLAESIKNLGLLHPPIIDGNYKLIDGERRIRALQHLGLDEIEVRFVNVPSLLMAEHDANAFAKQWTVSEKVSIARAIEEEIGDRRGGDRKSNVEISTNDPLAGKRTDEIAAEKAGFGSKDSYRQAKKVVDLAIPEIVEKMDAGELSVNAALIATAFTEEEQAEIVEEINAGAKPSEVIKAHVAHNSGENEWYTPEVYIQSAKVVLGVIDLDPASCELANATVKAAKYYTKDDNGLDKEWAGNVWVNPPYAQPLISQFSEKVVAEKENIEQAIVLVNNATETKWFANMAKSCDAICFPQSRIKFIDKQGKPSGAPLQGQAFIYFGDHKTIFAQEFSQFGFVLSHV